MRRPVRTAGLLGVTLLLACTALASASAPAADARVQQGWAGMFVPMDGPANLTGSDREWDRMVGAGVESARVTFLWAQLQVYPDYVSGGITDRNPTDFQNGVGNVPTDFAVSDSIVRSAAARNVRLLPVVVQAPTWAGAPLLRPGAMLVPRDLGTYANYLKTLIRRYGPRGTFWAENPGLTPRPIRQWQVWNEPNVDYFWGGDNKTWVDSFVRLLKVAHDAIKQEDPGAKVVLPGLSDYGNWDAAAALNRIYNNRVYSRDAMRHLFDVAALHPYVVAPKDVVRMAKRFRKVMNKNGDSRKQQTISEMSWPSSKVSARRDRAVNSGGIDVTERDQARKIAEVYPLLARARRALRLASVYWYAWGSEDRSNYPFSYSGLRRIRGTGSRAKPAYAAWANAVRKLEGCRNVAKRSATRCG